jgi:single-strand DNA-binding protein
MPQDINTVTISGNVTRDVELRFTPSGQATCTLGVAVSRRWQDRQSQEWKEATSFFDVVCWGKLAENVASSVVRGTRVVVTGRLDQRSWETQEGDKRSKIEITADQVAPSLQYASAQVTRNPRDDAHSGNGHSNGYAPAPAAAPAAGYSSPDEEPF